MMKKFSRSAAAALLALLLLASLPTAVLAAVFTNSETTAPTVTAPETAEPPTVEPSGDAACLIDSFVKSGSGVRGDSDERGEIAYVAGTPTAGNKAINGSWASLIGKNVTYLALSFTIEKLTDAIPNFQIRIRDITRKHHTPILAVTSAGELRLFGNAERVIGRLGDDPVELYFEIDIGWASETGVSDGHLKIGVYVDGVYLGLHELPLLCAEPDTIQLIAQADENPYVGPNNGVYLTDGVPNAVEGEEAPDEEKTVYGANDVEGWYAVCKMSAMNAYSASVRKGFAYPESDIYPSGHILTTGVRFHFGLDRAWYDGLAGEKTVGAIILPTDRLGGKRLTGELISTLEAGRDYVHETDVGLLPAEEGDEVYRFSMSLVHLLDRNFTRSFTAIGYVETEDGTRYYTGAYASSAYEAAKREVTAPSDAEADPLALEVMGRAVELTVGENGGLTLAELAGYTSPYAIIHEAGQIGFEILGVDVTLITALIIDGKIYTGGWNPISRGDALMTVPSYTPDSAD